jgi:hypothetical protein
MSKSSFPARGRKCSATSKALLVGAMALGVPLACFAGGSKNGDPFSNGTFFSNEGTFQTTIRGKNLSGVATFSTANGEETASSGTFSVNFQGVAYSGNVDGSSDSASGTIAAVMEGSTDRAGEGDVETLVSSNVEVVGSEVVSGGTATVPIADQTVKVEVVTVDEFGNETTTTTTTSTDGRTETINLPDTIADVTGTVDEIATSDFNDVLYAAGSFTAKLRNSFPNQVFKGKGTMEFTQINFDLLPPALQTTVASISVKGSRISSTSQVFSPSEVTAPSIITTTELRNRGDITTTELLIRE